MTNDSGSGKSESELYDELYEMYYEVEDKLNEIRNKEYKKLIEFAKKHNISFSAGDIFIDGEGWYSSSC